jgi:CRP/FNR family cyclic AMP-dependent transcriptional regulator
MTVRGLFVNAKETRDLAVGDVVFQAGDLGAEMFGVISGTIELRKDGVALTQIGAEGTFGELAIIEHAPRSLTAVAVEPSKVAVIDERTFLYLVHETPTFAIQVMRSLAARIRQLDAGH